MCYCDGSKVLKETALKLSRRGGPLTRKETKQLNYNTDPASFCRVFYFIIRKFADVVKGR